MHVRSMRRQIRIGDKKNNNEKYSQTNKQALANWVKGYAHNMFNVFNKNNDLTSKLARDRDRKKGSKNGRQKESEIDAERTKSINQCVDVYLVEINR